MIWFYIPIFLISCFLLTFSSKWLIGALSRIALFLKLKEFVVGFFIMAFAASLPNFFVGIIAALNKIPELSFGDVIGGNIIDLSLVIGLAALLSKGGLSAQSRTVQGSSIFTIFIGILPLFLISDRYLSRFDGILLISSFIIYFFWLFSKKERFTKVYDHASKSITELPSMEAKVKKRTKSSLPFKNFLKDLLFVALSTILLLVGAKGVVDSASVFATVLNLPIALIGLFIVGLGNCLPETFFSIQAAKKGQDWMVLGDLMGGVVITATLVLGTVALICPIKIVDFSLFAIARIFLIISALFFLFFVRTGRKITRKEAFFLMGIYLTFLLVEILMK